MANPGNEESELRDHVYDGIQEFDKRLPNWWLWTLYGAIIFSFAYWSYNHWSGVKDTTGVRLRRGLEQIALAKAGDSASLSPADLWAMSRNPEVVEHGKQTFLTTCASCHAKDLSGGIGPNLADAVWIHGGTPEIVMRTITEGVAAKGMPAWGTTLGGKRVVEVAAFVLSHHEPPAEPAAE